jgi:hypothetical protein
MGRVALALLAGTAATLVSCTDATGSVQGGDPVFGGQDGGGGTTWTSLYASFFGPSGTASCSAQASCHGGPDGSGSQTSGFICGADKHACWRGMTQGVPPDAGGVFPPIVPATASQDPTQTQLWGALHKQEASGLNNMPCGDPVCHPATSTYTFTSDDLARISTWIAQGAQDN